jgi:hypothetical protein
MISWRDASTDQVLIGSGDATNLLVWGRMLISMERPTPTVLQDKLKHMAPGVGIIVDAANINADRQKKSLPVKHQHRPGSAGKAQGTLGPQMRQSRMC